MVRNKMHGIITITFGECVENHVGMQKIGELADYGLNFADLNTAQERLEAKNIASELIDLGNDAWILVVRNGVNAIAGVEIANNLYAEHIDLAWDKRAKQRGKVVNKHARYNLCYADFSQEPNYEIGCGRVINFEDVMTLQLLRDSLPLIFGPKCENLYAEGNYYYDKTSCGIGFHGDAERKIVIAARLGESMNLVYQWYQNCEKVGLPIRIELNHGDLYAMSEKATGHDWRKKSILTLRHAAGCNKFTG